MVYVKVIREKLYVESIIIHEKGLQKVIFIPVPAAEHPILGIFEGIENVVEMDQHSAL
jgi:hypothetical protein